MQRNKIFFHIGMPKTATSYMQKYVFPIIPNIHYLGKFFEEEHNFFDQDFRYDIIFLSYEEFICKYSKTHLEDIFRPYLDKDILISEEGIIGYIFLPNANPLSEHNANFVINIMKLLYIAKILNVIPNFIITIRYQVDLLTSMYAENYNKFYRFNGNTNTFDKFIKYYMREYNILNFGYLHETFTSITDAKVHYLFYEQMKLKPENYLQELGKVLSQDLTGMQFKNEVVNGSDQGNSKKIKSLTFYQFLQRIKYMYFKNYSIKLPDAFKKVLNFKILSNKKLVIEESQKDFLKQFYKDKNKNFIKTIQKENHEVYL